MRVASILRYILEFIFSRFHNCTNLFMTFRIVKLFPITIEGFINTVHMKHANTPLENRDFVGEVTRVVICGIWREMDDSLVGGLAGCRKIRGARTALFPARGGAPSGVQPLRSPLSPVMQHPSARSES